MPQEVGSGPDPDPDYLAIAEPEVHTFLSQYPTLPLAKGKVVFWRLLPGPYGKTVQVKLALPDGDDTGRRIVDLSIRYRNMGEQASWILPVLSD